MSQAFNVLVVGSGAREHALCWRFAKSPLCGKLYCAPGNPGIAASATCLPVPVDHLDEIVETCRRLSIDFVMIGPELPLALGLADRLRAAGFPCFGPNQNAAQLESSKGFMKDLCARMSIPTAAYARFQDAEKAKAYVRAQGAPIVIKADGLAAGKGVTVAQTLDEALGAIEDAMENKAFGDSGAEIVVEAFMQGEEASFFALTDGETILPFTTAQDHKAVFDGDKGPNTGGMGAYSPASIVTPALHDRIMKEIIEPTVRGMKEGGTPFSGVLYAGLMLTAEGPKLIEYNARFGDPETQVMLPRLKTDLLEVLYNAAQGKLAGTTLDFADTAAVCVVMASNGYPGSYQNNTVIRGVDKANAMPDTVVFHAGTAINPAGDLVSHGGRVLGVTSFAPTMVEAQQKAYAAIDQIDWPEGFCRHDIGWREIARQKK